MASNVSMLLWVLAKDAKALVDLTARFTSALMAMPSMPPVVMPQMVKSCVAGSNSRSMRDRGTAA